jgi:hypothetical protein
MGLIDATVTNLAGRYNTDMWPDLSRNIYNMTVGVDGTEKNVQVAATWVVDSETTGGQRFPHLSGRYHC